MPVESQRIVPRAAWQKLRGCYRAGAISIGCSAQSRSVEIAQRAKENGAYGIRTRDLLNAIEALYQLS
jgi:hypothetical protein